MQADLARIDGIQTSRDLAAVAGYLSSIAAGGPFDAQVSVDATNLSVPVVRLMQGGTLLPDRSYYLSADPALVVLRGQYQAYLATIFRIAGRNMPERDADAVLALETQFAAAQIPEAGDSATPSAGAVYPQVLDVLNGERWPLISGLVAGRDVRRSRSADAGAKVSVFFGSHRVALLQFLPGWCLESAAYPFSQRHALCSVQRLGDDVSSSAWGRHEPSSMGVGSMSDARFDRIDRELATVTLRFDGVDREISGLKDRLDRVDARLDRMDVHLGSIDNRFGALDQRIGVLHEDLIDRIEASSERNAVSREEFRRTISDLTEKFGQRLDPLETAVREHRREAR